VKCVLLECKYDNCCPSNLLTASIRYQWFFGCGRTSSECKYANLSFLYVVDYNLSIAVVQMRCSLKVVFIALVRQRKLNFGQRSRFL
jgi:hypothetical protein